jgi:hypothetical protein
MHHSQQDQKNRVSQRKLQVFTISYSQETPAVATTGRHVLGGSFPPKAAKLAGQKILSGRLRVLGTTKGALPRFFEQVQDLS